MMSRKVQEDLFTLRTDRLPTAVALAPLVPPVRGALEKALDAARAGTKGKVRRGRRLRVAASSALEFRYSHAGRGYTAWLVGGGMELHFPDRGRDTSPITRALCHKVGESRRQWSRWRAGRAVRSLREASEMAEAAEPCRAVFESAAAGLPRTLRTRARTASLRTEPWYAGAGETILTLLGIALFCSPIFLVIAVRLAVRPGN